MGICESKTIKKEKPNKMNESLLKLNPDINNNKFICENNKNNNIANNKYDRLRINLSYFFENNPSVINFKYELIFEINGILKLFYIKFISSIIKNEQLTNIENINLRKILNQLNSDLELKNNEGIIKDEDFLPSDIKTILSQKKGNNIIEYSKYVTIVQNKEIENLIRKMEIEQKQKIFRFLNNLKKYEKYNAFFEEEFTKAQKESIFDYSIVSLALLDNKNIEVYENAKKNCKNCIQKLLFHGSSVDPVSKIISSEFKYTRKAFYGMGIYFSDNLDYVSFYSGADNYEKRRDNFNKILPPNSTFTFISAEIFYDQKLFTHIRTKDYFVNELDHFPTYEEINQNYHNKMIPKNGIHFITVQAEQGNLLENSIISKDERQKGKFIGNEYVITELEQIFKLYAVKVKRNEFLVLWRDLNFEGQNIHTNYLKKIELFSNEIAKMNIYLESNTERALKFIYKKRFNKIILVTSVGLDLSGKKFIEIARKILKSNVIVLVFSNNKNHLEWIQKTPNLLYTDDGAIYQEYITNYNEIDLKKLKNSVELKYNIKLLDFTNDFLSYPLYIDSGKYSEITIPQISPYIREVYIFNPFLNLILIMNKNGNLEMINDLKKAYTWDITLDDNNELTIFSNGYYLIYDEGKKIIQSNKYMKRWYYEQISEFYIIKPLKNNNLMLYINNNIFNLSNVITNNSLFKFIDIQSL